MKRLTILFLCLVAILLINVAAQTKRPMTFEDVMAIKNLSDAQISPDGRWVSYVVTNVDMKQNLSNADVWLVSTEGASPPVRLTTSPKNDNQPRWSPDGKQVAFISAREERPQIFLISPFGGEAERLTESKTGVQSFQWSPDGDRIAYVAERAPTSDEEKKLKDKDDAQVVDENFKYSDLWVLDIRTRKEAELVKSDYVVRDPQWSPDSRSIAYTVTPTPRADDGNLTDIWVVAAESGKPRRLIENEGPDTAPRWSPDARWIAFLSRDSKNGLLGQSKISVIPVEGGTPRIVAPSFEYQPGPVTWSRDGKNLYFNASVRTSSQLFSVPLTGGEAKQISNVSGVMAQATFSRDRWMSAFVKSDIQNPPEIHVARSLSLINPVKLTGHNSQLKEINLGTHEVVRWKSSDGMEIEGVVIYPVGFQRGKRYPMVSLIHGGPSGVWTESFPASWGNFGHVWAGKGWVVFYPNCRGSSAYGEKFLLSNVRDWGGGDFQDIQSGIDYLVSRGVADPEKLAQSGWSYGGYMTAWTLTQTDRFKAVMVGAGLTNMYSMYSTNDLQRVLEGYFGGQPWDDTDIYWRKSAMAFIKKAKTPTLILHGAEDKRVPVGQAQELYMGLRKNSVPVELVFYPREPHGLREPRHQLDKMRREYSWFSKHVLGVETFDPKPEKEKPSGGKVN